MMPVQELPATTTDAAPIILEGDCTIVDAEAWQRRFIDWLAGHTSLVLNLSGVEHCDAAFLQLLCALRQAAALRGCPYRLAGLSAAVVDAAAELGLDLAELTGAPKGAGGVV